MRLNLNIHFSLIAVFEYEMYIGWWQHLGQIIVLYLHLLFLSIPYPDFFLAWDGVVRDTPLMDITTTLD